MPSLPPVLIATDSRVPRSGSPLTLVLHTDPFHLAAAAFDASSSGGTPVVSLSNLRPTNSDPPAASALQAMASGFLAEVATILPAPVSDDRVHWLHHLHSGYSPPEFLLFDEPGDLEARHLYGVCLRPLPFVAILPAALAGPLTPDLIDVHWLAQPGHRSAAAAAAVRAFGGQVQQARPA